MPRQSLQGGPVLDAPITAPLNADVGTGAVSMWSGAQFTPIFAYQAYAGSIWTVKAGGVLTTAATGALTISPGLGTTSPGTTLGASIAQTVPASMTAVPWFLHGCFVVRTVGAAGANSTIIGEGTFIAAGLAATASTGLQIAFGGTSCAFDYTVNNFFTFQKTLSVAGSFTTHWVILTPEN